MLIDFIIPKAIFKKRVCSLFSVYIRHSWKVKNWGWFSVFLFFANIPGNTDTKGKMIDMGPMITEEEAARVEKWAAEASQQGAELLTGGKREGTRFDPQFLITCLKAPSLTARRFLGRL